MNPILMLLFLVIGFGVFAYQMRPKLQVLFKLKPDVRFDSILVRAKKAFWYGLVQIRMFKRPWAGLAHMFIFATFMATQLATLVYFVRGFVADFALPLREPLLSMYQFLKDAFWLLCLIGILYWVAQRLIVKPWRIRTSEHQAKALLILSFIASLGLSEFLMQGAERALVGLGFSWSLPASSLVGVWLQDAMLSVHVLHTLVHIGFWVHVGVVLTFLNFLPSGKHFHVIWAIFNIFTSSLKVRGYVDAPDLEKADKFGIATVTDLTWKQAVDTYSCTECGRCLDFCPTALTDKPLTHRGLNVALKQELWSKTPHILGLAKESANTELPPLVGEQGAAVHPETVWACTTCGACEVECPVFIEQVPRIVLMRQNLVLMQGEFPQELNRTFKGMEQHSNPWGMNADNRDAWAKDLDIPTAAEIANENKEIPLLYWIGCAGSFDDRVKKITLAMVRILKAANIPFCILGKEEGCTGDPARRLGNEYLFQMLASTNIATLKNYKVKKILTHCPHCLQTLKHDYKGMGADDWQVLHHSEFLAELLQSGQLKLTQGVDGSVVFHDSCYLTRYNGIVDAPRQVLKSIPKLKVLEFDNNKEKGVCCGAGGGRFWMEEKIGKRINHLRVEDGLKQNPDTMSSACPFCLTMLSDAVKDKGAEEQVKNKDIAELIASAL